MTLAPMILMGTHQGAAVISAMKLWSAIFAAKL
jgi:hypothetical protein